MSIANIPIPHKLGYTAHMPKSQVTFLGSIADTSTAIKVSGAREGLRLTLDIPETDIDAYLPLVALRGYPLRITIEIDSHAPLTLPDKPTID